MKQRYQLIWLIGFISLLSSVSVLAQETEGFISIEVHPKPYRSVNEPTDLPADLTYSKQAKQRNQYNSVDSDQLRRIEQEILLLKAELMLKQGNFTSLKGYIEQLNHQVILPEFRERVALVKHFYMARKIPSNKSTEITIPQEGSGKVSPFPSSKTNRSIVEVSPVSRPTIRVSSIQPLSFPWHDEDSVVVIMLPLSEGYGEVGQVLSNSLQESLVKQGYSGKVVTVDTALYSSATEMMDLVTLYKPSFVFGPLEKDLAHQWQALGTGIPTFYFNQMADLNGYERALSPNKSRGIDQVFTVLDRSHYENVIVLTDQSDESRKLESAFYQNWISQFRAGSYEHVEVEGLVTQSISDVLNARASLGRKQWLQKKVGKTLTFTPRVRGDVDAIVSFLPRHEAIQVTPMLEFYQLSEVAHIWYPSSTPIKESLKESLPSWQRSFAILPAHYHAYVHNSQDVIAKNEKVGLFHALGKLAAEIVKNTSIVDGMNIYMESEYGVVVSDQFGQFNLLPSIYWVHDGQLDLVARFSEVLPDEELTVQETVE